MLIYRWPSFTGYGQLSTPDLLSLTLLNIADKPNYNNCDFRVVIYVSTSVRLSVHKMFLQFQ